MIAALLSPVIAASVHPLATVNALLNALAGVLLVIGFVLIKRGNETAHRRTMLSAFAVSVLFLVCYLAYHVWPVGAATTPFRGTGAIKTAYYGMLYSHIILAAIVPVLAILTIRAGLQDRRERHRRLARWTLPIWLYVSVTGVAIYWMLYYLYPQS